MGKKEKKEEPEVEGHAGKIYFNSEPQPLHCCLARWKRSRCRYELVLSQAGGEMWCERERMPHGR